MSADVPDSHSIRRSILSPSTIPPPRFTRYTHAAFPWFLGMSRRNGLEANATLTTVRCPARWNASAPRPACGVVKALFVGEYIESIIAIGRRIAAASLSRRWVGTRRCHRVRFDRDFRRPDRGNLDPHTR